MRLKRWMRDTGWRPEALFLFFAVVGGLALAVMIPPALGGNETFNYQRAMSVALFHWMIEPAAVPSGIVRFLEISWDSFPEGATPPYSYGSDQFDALASLDLGADHPRELRPNAIAVLHPFSYLPQLPLLWLGTEFGLRPIVLFYIGKVAGLVAGVALTFHAIRIIPVHKHLLAALALLPTILFSRSTLDADQFTNGLAFLFVAMVMREIMSAGPIARRTLVSIAVVAFILAQCKSAYLLLPFFALCIPAAQFGSGRAKLAACCVIALPGLVGSLAWMIALKQTYFAGIGYRTWAGWVVPHLQQSFILNNPVDYAVVLFRTIFLTPFIPDTLIAMIGLFGPPVMLPIYLYPLLGVAITAVALTETNSDAQALRRIPVRLLAGLLFVVGTIIVLTLLYIQWNSPAAPTIRGFHGRYLYPLVPLLFVLLPGNRKSAARFSASASLAALGTVSVASTCLVTYATYLA